MDRAEYLNIILCAVVNHRIRTGGSPDLEELGKKTFLALEKDMKDRSPVIFECDQKSVPFNQWVETLLQKKPAGIGLTSLEAFGFRRDRPILDDKQIEETVFRGFEGSSSMLLAVVFPGRIELWGPTLQVPREIFDGRDWDGFIESVISEETEEFIRVFMSSIRHPRLPESGDQSLERLRFFYQSLGMVQDEELPAKPVMGLNDELHSLLEELSRYSGERGLQDWQEFFQAADLVLRGAANLKFLGPIVGWVPEQESLALLDAAMIGSSAFGGSSSWNDVPVRRDPRYRELSGKLLRLTDLCMMSVVNGWMKS